MRNFFYLNITPSAFLRRAEVQDLRDLAPRRVGAVEAERARRVGESRPVGALHRRSSAVAVARPTAVVPESKPVLDVGPDGHRSLELDFCDVVDAVVGGVAAVSDFQRVPTLRLTGWVLKLITDKLAKQ